MPLIMYDEISSDWQDLEASKNFELAMNDRFSFDRGFIEIKRTDFEDLEFLEAFTKVGERAATKILATARTSGFVCIDQVHEDSKEVKTNG